MLASFWEESVQNPSCADLGAHLTYSSVASQHCDLASADPCSGACKLNSYGSAERIWVLLTRHSKHDKCLPRAGKPVFGTLIALLRDGVPVLGVIDQPITKERWLGVQGRTTTLNGEPETWYNHCAMLAEPLLVTIYYCGAPAQRDFAIMKVRIHLQEMGVPARIVFTSACHCL